MNLKLPRIAALFCFALVCGCGSPEYETVPTHPVSGQITVNGVPAKGAIVRLHPQAPQPGAKYPLLPSGRTNEAGEYQLTTFEGSDGAPPGEYVVTVEWPDPAWRPPGGGMPPPPPDRLKGRFASPKSSTIKTTIEEGENEMTPIVLEKVEILQGSTLE
ncbi:MAG: carboxypeptidase-like regulatory domain-containing protein [Planctomycetota bacterium]